MKLQVIGLVLGAAFLVSCGANSGEELSSTSDTQVEQTATDAPKEVKK